MTLRPDEELRGIRALELNEDSAEIRVIYFYDTPDLILFNAGVLLRARHTVFLGCGEDKAPAVRAVFQDDYDPLRLPSQVIAHHGRSVSWFFDDAASRLL